MHLTDNAESVFAVSSQLDRRGDADHDQQKEERQHRPDTAQPQRLRKSSREAVSLEHIQKTAIYVLRL